MNELKIFENATFGKVRVIEEGGELFFVAKDVAEALGYTWSGSSRIAHVPDEWKGATSVVTPGGKQELSTLSEQGLYFFLGRSDKKAALPYQKWIAGEVMPTLRKTGQYGAPALPTSYAAALRALAAEVEIREAVEKQKALAESQRDEAIRTKAEIGSRREATAMATASAAVRKVNTLEDELGRGKRYKAVKAIPWLLDEFVSSNGMYSQVGKTLKRISVDLGYSIEKIETKEYPEGINAYHVDVINALRTELACNPGMLSKYRVYRGNKKRRAA